LYRKLFKPSPTLERPHTMIGVGVTCAETDDEAFRLAAPAALSFLRVRTGRPSTLPSPEEAAAYNYTPEERVFVDNRIATQVIGSPDTVRDRLTALLHDTNVDELMITTTTFDPADRTRSFELVADLAGLAPLPEFSALSPSLERARPEGL
jgi:alkanesulfonate monooxygenase SsuD/methylene tetrahydromethanopterin reductase-like flavin-dependent oxidoreductase (luciferase family)